MGYSQEIDSGVDNPTAFTFQVAALDGIMPDTSTAKVEVIAIGYAADNGDGTYNIEPIGLTKYLPVDDATGSGLLEEIRDATTAQAADIGGVSSWTNQTVTAIRDANAMTTYGAIAVVTLSDTTVTDLFVTASDDSRIDLIGGFITNLDTASALVDFTCDTQTTTIAVDAGKTYPLNTLIRGIVNTTWTVALQANPATSNVQITSTARIAPNFY